VQWPETLIAMATHARSGLRRWVHGSVADKVVHDTTIPLLLVRGTEPAAPPNPRLVRILVPLDGSAFASQALVLAIELAARAQAELTLLWVAAPSIEEYMGSFPTAAELRQVLRDEAARAFAAVGYGLPREPVPLTTAISLGPTAETIAEEARRRRADLIVMATHGYTGLERWRLGSVADTLLHLTPTPLVLVRGQAGEGSATAERGFSPA
jgi:nucleotide-binding universal stress UspA family protein